ncbi:NACHT and WD40 repeat domain-containing protein [Nonomuraea sp. NPDC050556]|uniref:NACHT and WD40 repeat domain-containing protein n=1 Tax=Nonomuraea sp. NPDC050556 TaxID=3364369 RepID=UPI00378A68EA
MLLLTMVAAFAVGAWFLVIDLPTGDMRASVLSFFVGLGNLLLAVAEFLRRPPEASTPARLADELAVKLRRELIDHQGIEALNKPYVLPLSWSAGDQSVGRLRRGVMESAKALSAEYLRVASGRMVILGEPGAGKSILARLLAWGLLHDRGDAPVPVLLTATSWDPVNESLDDWIVGTLAVNNYGGNRDTPRELLRSGLILPIIDGLDEMSEAARRVAIQAVNEAIGRERPVVITCRSVEYGELIASGAPALKRAPVVRLQPLLRRDVVAYLREFRAPGLAPLVDELTRDPGGPAAQALSTPLMVSLARNVSEQRAVDLRDCDSRTAVEDKLVEAAARPAAAGDGRWLTFLARYLHAHHERELAWWLLAPRLVSPWAVATLGLVGGAVATALATAWILISGTVTDLNAAFLLGTAVGAGFAILVMVAWYVGGIRTPGRLTLQTAGSADRLRLGAVTGSGLAVILTVPILLGLAGVITFAYGWSPMNIDVYLGWLARGGAVMVVTAVALAIYRWLDAPPGGSVDSTPAKLLAADRASALAGALAAGAIVGLGLGPALLAGQVALQMLQSAVTGWSGEPAPADIAAVELTDPWVNPPVLLPGVLFASLTLLTRAWPRFAWARFVLAARRRTPWRLMRALEGAHRAGLLQRSGGTYQFRHIRLQEWLATRTRAAAAAPRRPRVRLLAAGGLTVVTATAAVLLASLPTDISSATLYVGAIGNRYLTDDGRMLIAKSADGRDLHIWDVATGRPVGSVLRGQDKDDLSLNLSSDGRLAALVSKARQTLTILDTSGLRPLRSWPLPPNDPRDDYFWVTFSPDGSLAAVQKLPGYTLYLYDVRTGTQLGGTLAENIRTLAFSSSGNLLTAKVPAGQNSSRLLVWNARTGSRIGGDIVVSWSDSFSYFSPDGDLLVTTSPKGDTHLTDARTGRPLQPPLRGYYALSGDYLVKQAADGVHTRRLRGDPDPRRYPDLRNFVISGTTLVGVNGRGDVRVYDLVSGKETGRMHTGLGPHLSLTLHPDGRTLMIRQYPEPDGSIDPRPNPTVWLWDLRGGTQLGTLQTGTTTYTMDVSFGSHTVLVRRPSQKRPDWQMLDVFNLDTRTLLTNRLPDYTQEDSSLSPSQDWLAVLTPDKRSIELWNVAEGRREAVLTGHTGEIHSYQFSKDSTVLNSSSADGTIKIWRIPKPGTS